MPRYYFINKECPKCHSKMIPDDRDYNFDGCQDEWYVCENENCEVSAFVKVRYGKICRVIWRDGETTISL